MSTPLLHKVYDSSIFKEEGDHLINLLSDYLSKTVSMESEKVINWSEPDEEYLFWKNFKQKGYTTSQLFQTVIERSIHTHHPHYIGHQVAPSVPLSALATLLSAQLNNGMAVYEMGAASTALERVVIEFFTQALGFKNGDGFLTSGGTLANLTALLAARSIKASSDVWNEGATHKLAILVSEEAHYCVDRSARIMGLGSGGIIKIPSDKNFKMRTDLLETYYAQAINNGFEIIAVVGSAPSTSTGVYDDLEAISAFAKAKNIWFHIDAAHGGAAIFSSKYKQLLNGANQADSIIIDGHKMMGISAITTAVLFKKSTSSYAAFEQKAQYLWEKNDDPDWFNLAKRTFECTKSMMSLRFYVLINAYGSQFFEDFLTTLYDTAINFGAFIKEQKDFELALDPVSNIVCFRHIGKGGNLDDINLNIRRSLLEDGIFYIVSTRLRGDFFLRMTVMNPFTNMTHLAALLENIRKIVNNK
ncbi:pyridoxal phosphate-dependent decarboxylase family protein [Dokdonia sp. Hel_I_53]|uniref:pyridoxal phosphate-dependent decarboxylase family protein n=1 Tax=Dokdonia sp. Hel_I_53 TaxID=1566287 RepID=UPI00119C42DF|nr:aminotransferase class I/II-fold pyridoxal phosphate-dependent enzyme [Dokdonia sp. Hel_I_53]TVZ52489.1 L-2,4-diaminobutyrate decarboxylase [Dokdonia sp. Hel_I_53]